MYSRSAVFWRSNNIDQGARATCLGPVQTLLEGWGVAQTMSSQAAYAVLVELCQHSSTASAGLQAVAAGAKGAEQTLVPRMQASPCLCDASHRCTSTEVHHKHWTLTMCLGLCCDRTCSDRASLMQEILRHTVSACNELLRHFWAQFPSTSAKRVGTSAILM